MPQLQHFTADTLPDHFGWQILDFVRIHWFDIFAHKREADVYPITWHPHYFVVTEARALLSAAVAIWEDRQFNGETYRTYGLTGVMTYPAFRKKGYGLQVATAATDYIKQQADADLAILWTGTDLEAFYDRNGWAYPHTFSVMLGDPANPTRSNFPMLLYLSDRGHALQQSLAGGALYFGNHSW